VDIIGHLAVVEHAGISGDEVWAQDAQIALFPNLAHCHEWAYQRLREDLRRPVDRTEKLIQGHIITDWVIHYGTKLTPQRHRIGWAYDEAPRIAEGLDRFVDDALAAGLAEVDPRDHDERAHLERDFGHTVAECALDLRVGEPLAGTQRFENLKATLAKLADQEYARQLIEGVFSHTGGYTREAAAVLERTTKEYGAWAGQVRHPEDFAALTLCTRFDWPYERATVDYVVSYLHDVGKRLDKAAAERIVDDIVHAIADPMSLALSA